MPTPKPRTPKQIAQEAQTPIIKTSVITATITVITTAITITIKKIKGKVKGRVLPLKRWYKRLSHLNYVDVK